MASNHQKRRKEQQQQQQKEQKPLQQSPIGARRVRTDLKTSENIFLTAAIPRTSRTPHTPRTSSPITIKYVTCDNPQQLHSPSHNTHHRTAARMPQTFHGVHKSYLPHAIHMQQSSRRTSSTVAASISRSPATTMTTTATKSTSTLGAVCNCWCHCAATTVLSASAPHANATYLSAHLPARATRLLNRSRLQQQQYPASSTSGLLANAGAGASGGGADSDSSKSTHSLRRSGNASRASNASTSSTNASQPLSSHYHHQKPFQHHYSQLYRDSHSSSDDLMLYDKSFRNAMIQDVLQFKKQLLRLRRILQETDTLNPFDDDNGQLFAACGLDSKLLDDMDLTSLASSITDDPMVELADLRRQVVYLQGEVEDRERTIRLQKNQIESLESKKPAVRSDSAKECINTATQTERTRPLSYGPEGLSRSKPEYTSYTTHYHPAASCDNNSLCSSATTSNNSLCTHHQQQKQQQHNCNGSNNNLPAAASEAASQQIRRHTIISTTLSNYNQQLPLAPRRASIAWEKPTATAPTTAATLTQTSAAGTAIHAPTANIYKPVKITLIGEPLKQWQWNAASNGKTTAAVQSNGTTSTISNDSVKGVKSETNGGGGDAGDGNWNGRNKSNGNSDGMCNGLTNGLSKEFKNGLCNGAADSYGSNGYSRTNGSSNNYKVKAIGGVGNGKQLGCGSVVDLHNGQQNQMIYQQQQNHHVHKPHIKQALLPPGQQQQQKTQLASRNSHQQQQKPLQVYQTPNGTNGTNANFNPTVTIV